MENKENLYRILGVAEDVSEEELKLAYRKLAKRYHPDAHPNDRQSEKKFQTINEAYRILGNPEKRKKYDQERKYTDNRKEGKNAQSARSTGKQYQDPGFANVDFENIHRTFETFFGFDPNLANVAKEEKRSSNTGNPLDTSDMFERFMGIKR